MSCTAHKLVEKLIRANRIAAEHVLSVFPQLAVLHRQKPPNQEQLVKALKKHENVIAHSPAYKTLADSLNIKLNPEFEPVVIMEVLRKHL